MEGEPSGGAEDVKSDTHINIKVVSQDNEVHFRIKRTTPLSKLMNTYCERQGKPPGSVRFMIDGNRLNDTMTPEDLDLEEGYGF
jgi:small ubiquitin-related modifier